MASRIADTKREVQAIYFNWPDRKEDQPGKSMLFQEYLRLQDGYSYMQFGAADKHQIITGWLDEWDRYLP